MYILTMGKICKPIEFSQGYPFLFLERFVHWWVPRRKAYLVLIEVFLFWHIYEEFWGKKYEIYVFFLDPVNNINNLAIRVGEIGRLR